MTPSRRTWEQRRRARLTQILAARPTWSLIQTPLIQAPRIQRLLAVTRLDRVLAVAPLRAGWAPLLLSNVLKLVAVPALTLALAPLIGLSCVALQVAVLFNALPSSASSYVFARALGGDHELMAAILTTQVAMAAVTLPLFIALVG